MTKLIKNLDYILTILAIIIASWFGMVGDTLNIARGILLLCLVILIKVSRNK